MSEFCCNAMDHALDRNYLSTVFAIGHNETWTVLNSPHEDESMYALNLCPWCGKGLPNPYKDSEVQEQQYPPVHSIALAAFHGICNYIGSEGIFDDLGPVHAHFDTLERYLSAEPAPLVDVDAARAALAVLKDTLPSDTTMFGDEYEALDVLHMSLDSLDVPPPPMPDDGETEHCVGEIDKLIRVLSHYGDETLESWVFPLQRIRHFLLKYSPGISPTPLDEYNASREQAVNDYLDEVFGDFSVPTPPKPENELAPTLEGARKAHLHLFGHLDRMIHIYKPAYSNWMTRYMETIGQYLLSVGNERVPERQKAEFLQEYMTELGECLAIYRLPGDGIFAVDASYVEQEVGPVYHPFEPNTILELDEEEPISEDQYIAMTGRMPTGDNLERANCDQAGQIDHVYCGICPVHEKPRFICMCKGETND
jgi:hypothetical protein